MIILIILVLIFLFLFANWYYLHIVQTFGNYILRAKEGNWDCLCFGSTMGRWAIDFSQTDVNAYNLCVGPQFLPYSEKMLHQYSKYLNPRGTIIFVIADFVFGSEGIGWYNASETYTRFLDKKYLKSEYNLKNNLKQNYFPLCFKPLLILEVIKSIVAKLNQHKINRIKYLSEKEIDDSAQKITQAWTHDFKLKDMYSLDLPDSIISEFEKTKPYLTRMIQYCIDNKFKPVLVVAPVSRALNNICGKGLINRVLYQNIAEANIQKIPLLDYQYDLRFQSKELYRNSFCMNKKGAYEFTEVLIQDLRKLGCLL